MNKLLTWSMAMFLPIAVCAQSPVKFQKSTETTEEEKSYTSSTIEMSGQGYFYFGIDYKRYKPNAVEVIHFSPELQLKGKKSNELSDEWKQFTSAPDVYQLKDHVYFFMREVYKESSTEGLAAVEFQPSTLNFSKDKKIVVKTNGKVHYDPYGPYEFYECRISKNKARMMVLYTKAHEKNRDKLSFEEKVFTVVDENLTPIWSKEIKMLHSESDMEIYQYLVTNSGKVYMLVAVKNPKDERKKNVDGHFEILVFDQNTIDKPTVFIPSFDNNYARNSELIENEKGEVFLTGMFSKNTGRIIDGFYALKLEESTGWATKYMNGFYEIPEDLIKSNQNRKELRKLDKEEEKDDSKDVGVTDLIIRYSDFTENGDMIILAEQHRSVATQTRYSTTYRIHDDDIYFVRIRANGESWIRKINKAQYSTIPSGYELSFNYIIKNNDVYVLFVDSKRNISKGLDQVPEVNGHGPKNYICCVAVTPEGQMSKSIVLNEINEDCEQIKLSNYARGKNNSLYKPYGVGKKVQILTLKTN